MITEIKSTDDILLHGQKLDEHVLIDSYFKKGEEFESAPKHKFVWNIQKESIANSVSNSFQIIQHRDIFSTIHQAFTNLNLDLSGRLDDSGDLVKMDLTFNGQELIDDNEKGIKLGVRIINSNNKKSSFRLEMFAFRLICQNGMSIGNIIPQVRECQVHFGKEKIQLESIRLMTEKFVKNVINHSDKLQILVNNSMKDSIEWDIVKKIMETSIGSKKFMKSIAEKLGIDVVEVLDKKTNRVKFEFICDPSKKINRWDLYNAITNVISHDSQLKPTIQNKLEVSSRSILKNNFNELVKIYVR